MAESDTSSSTPQKKSNSMVMIILGVIGVAIVAILGYQMLFGESSKPAAISGTLDFNGLKPAEQPNQAASIKLMQRAVGETEFTDTGIMIPVEDQASWDWTTAVSGTTYQLRADGYIGSDKIKSTNVVTATAPATDVALTFNITAADLPDSVRPTPQPEPVAVVSGTIVINGFVPANSTVNIYGRVSGTNAQFQPAIEDLPARNGMPWKYEKAEAGTTYDYQAELYTSDGTFIGQSKYLTVTAPAANEVVTINSTASQPSTTASISGVVKLQGPVDQNSTILVLQRKVGATDFTAIDRYPAVSGTQWNWDSAVSGTSYEITAALQVNDQNTASGNTVTVSAPAKGVAITIDTGVNLPAPTQTVSVECGSPDGTNHYNASVQIPQYPDAKLYYLEVGTAAGSSNTFSDTVQPNSNATVFVAGNAPYFARYSYSACTDCDTKDPNNWAGWSPTYGFMCQDGAATMVSTQ